MKFNLRFEGNQAEFDQFITTFFDRPIPLDEHPATQEPQAAHNHPVHLMCKSSCPAYPTHIEEVIAAGTAANKLPDMQWVLPDRARGFFEPDPVRHAFLCDPEWDTEYQRYKVTCTCGTEICGDKGSVQAGIDQHLGRNDE